MSCTKAPTQCSCWANFFFWIFYIFLKFYKYFLVNTKFGSPKNTGRINFLIKKLIEEVELLSSELPQATTQRITFRSLIFDFWECVNINAALGTFLCETVHVSLSCERYLLRSVRYYRTEKGTKRPVGICVSLSSRAVRVQAL